MNIRCTACIAFIIVFEPIAAIITADANLLNIAATVTIGTCIANNAVDIIKSLGTTITAYSLIFANALTNIKLADTMLLKSVAINNAITDNPVIEARRTTPDAANATNSAVKGTSTAINSVVGSIKAVSASGKGLSAFAKIGTASRNIANNGVSIDKDTANSIAIGASITNTADKAAIVAVNNNVVAIKAIITPDKGNKAAVNANNAGVIMSIFALNIVNDIVNTIIEADIANIRPLLVANKVVSIVNETTKSAVNAVIAVIVAVRTSIEVVNTNALAPNIANTAESGVIVAVNNTIGIVIAANTPVNGNNDTDNINALVEMEANKALSKPTVNTNALTIAVIRTSIAFMPVNATSVKSVVAANTVNAAANANINTENAVKGTVATNTAPEKGVKDFKNADILVITIGKVADITAKLVAIKTELTDIRAIPAAIANISALTTNKPAPNTKQAAPATVAPAPNTVSEAPSAMMDFEPSKP